MAVLMHGPHTHDFERERSEITEEIWTWAFEQHGFTKPDESSSSRQQPADVVPLFRRRRAHLYVIDGGRTDG